MKMRKTIPVMTPPQYNDFHAGRVFALAVPGDGAGEPARRAPVRFG
jgi:hypothetical protein